ncbi:hypothetical protein [Leptolyngbya sp. FACHB-16]|nr:hypothetical protein [Leptolyngbya sp. FACHB-16]
MTSRKALLFTAIALSLDRSFWNGLLRNSTAAPFPEGQLFLRSLP